MRVTRYITNSPASLLDVGCNVGAWLADCAARYPGTKLAGIDINESALDVARNRLPGTELHHGGAEALPFPDQAFEYVTCMEVLEHLPAELRQKLFREVWRVLQPGGRLILTVPHSGYFSWLDSNNIRLRFPSLFGLVVRKGLRDDVYLSMGRQVEWHYHFTLEELLELAGESWRLEAVRRGGLFTYPLMDWLSWPFYRAKLESHPIRRFFERVAGADYSIDYGKASYGILIVLERPA
jgi:SAM-dependent methyltransferase